MHGGSDVAHPVDETAQVMYDALTGSSDRKMFIVPGASQCVDLTHEPIVSQHVIDFLTHNPAIKTAPVKVDRGKALKALAKITGDPSVLERDPTVAVSYSSMSPETLATQRAMFDEGLARAKAYDGAIDVSGISPPWEKRKEGEWRFSKRHDFDDLSPAEADQLREASKRKARGSSAGLVEVLTDFETVED